MIFNMSLTFTLKINNMLKRALKCYPIGIEVSIITEILHYPDQ